MPALHFSFRILRLCLLFLPLLAFSPPLLGQDLLIKVPTRPGVEVPLYWMKREGAIATAILFPGGSGGLGRIEKSGRPTGNNFLIRSRDLFAARNLNIALVGAPSDTADLSFAFRTGAAHLEDIRKVVAHVKRQSSLPLWLVGTSRGTVSVTAAAIDLGNELSGIVLTASVTGERPGAVPAQDLKAIKVPVLVMHHMYDACAICRPSEAALIVRGLENAPAKKLVMANGGGNPNGDPCGALHWHGFIGMEQEAVDAIAAWIRRPD